MELYLAVGEEVSGPHGLDEVGQFLESQQIGPETLAQVVGDEEWRPLGELVELPRVPPVAAAPPVAVAVAPVAAQSVLPVGPALAGGVGGLPGAEHLVAAARRDFVVGVVCIFLISALGFGMAMLKSGSDFEVPPWYASVMWALPAILVLLGIGAALQSKACFGVVALLYAIDLALGLAIGIMAILVFVGMGFFVGVALVALFLLAKIIVMVILLRGMTGLHKMQLYRRQAAGRPMMY